MKYTLLFCLFIVTSMSAQNIGEVRMAYAIVDGDKGAIETLYSQLDYVSEDKIVLSAYKGAVMTMLAKYEKGGKKKKAYFKEGVGFIENAIKAQPNNIELRTIRLSIQENAPKFLKYNSHISEDKTMITNNFKKTKSKDVCDFVKNYVLQSDVFSEEEKGLF